MQRYIDNKFGGEGKRWYRIVKSAIEAEAVAKDEKLAIILGIKTDLPFLCGGGLCTTKDAYSQIDYYYNLGVRHIFPIHFYDNLLGGAAYDKSDLALEVEKPLIVLVTVMRQKLVNVMQRGLAH